MPTIEVAITIDSTVLSELDQLVAEHVFPNRSLAIQAALKDKLARLKRNRLACACAMLDPLEEQGLAEEGMDWELGSWPAY